MVGHILPAMDYSHTAIYSILCEGSMCQYVCVGAGAELWLVSGARCEVAKEPAGGMGSAALVLPPSASQGHT